MCEREPNTGHDWRREVRRLPHVGPGQVRLDAGATRAGLLEEVWQARVHRGQLAQECHQQGRVLHELPQREESSH